MALIKLNNQSLPSGSVLRILNAQSTAVLNTSTTWTDIPGMTLTITPTSTNSEFLISYTNHVYIQGITGQNWVAVGIRLLKDSTVIYTDGDSSYAVGHNLSDNVDRMMLYQPNQYLDSPNTTSAVTYHLEAATTQSSTACLINEPSYGSGGQITIMEFAG